MLARDISSRRGAARVRARPDPEADGVGDGVGDVVAGSMADISLVIGAEGVALEREAGVTGLGSDPLVNGFAPQAKEVA